MNTSSNDIIYILSIIFPMERGPSGDLCTPKPPGSTADMLLSSKEYLRSRSIYSKLRTCTGGSPQR